MNRASRDLESRDARGRVEVLTAALALPALKAAIQKKTNNALDTVHGLASGHVARVQSRLP